MQELLFAVTIRREGSVRVLACTGELDISTRRILSDALDEMLIDPPPLLHVDLTETTFFAGVGVDLLWHARARCRESGTLIQVSASPPVRRVLDVLAFPHDGLGGARGHRFAPRLRRRLRRG